MAIGKDEFFDAVSEMVLIRQRLCSASDGTVISQAAPAHTTSTNRMGCTS